VFRWGIQVKDKVEELEQEDSSGGIALVIALVVFIVALFLSSYGGTESEFTQNAVEVAVSEELGTELGDAAPIVDGSYTVYADIFPPSNDGMEGMRLIVASRLDGDTQGPTRTYDISESMVRDSTDGTWRDVEEPILFIYEDGRGEFQEFPLLPEE